MIDYIGKALEAAFAQTYEPLEILICDDCSNDCSDEIIRKAIAEYQAKDGRHKVRYYRNEQNLGNLGNWQRICELAEGELLVKADGDDYSVPTRTERLVEAWLREGKAATYLYSDGWAVDEMGRTLWDVNLSADYCIGAFEAYARRCCSEFGPTDPLLEHEAADDVVYVWRAKMLGNGQHVAERLVYYRQGSGETSCGLNFTHMMTRGFRFMLASAKQLLNDVEYYKERLTRQDYELLNKRFARSILHHQALIDLWLGSTYSVRKSGYEVARSLNVIAKGYGLFLLLPGWINKPVLNIIFSVNYWRKRRAVVD